MHARAPVPGAEKMSLKMDKVLLGWGESVKIQSDGSRILELQLWKLTSRNTLIYIK